ncbi:MAG: cell wall metabolism sensor histidine kinase WalK [Chloroflexi bacterium]|nr:cell wall metabolism sensor histidine kinase WalK [Chloroflexota bacterium]
MIESGPAEIMLRPVNLVEVVDKAIHALETQAEHAEITLLSEPMDGLCVLADQEQVARVLISLIHNAIKFTPEAGTITIRAEALEADEMIKVTVTDTGPGIPPEDRERIFERFYRGDRSRQSSGTGLGLAIAKHIIKAHSGEIWAEEPDAIPGAQISFTLPAMDA